MLEELQHTSTTQEITDVFIIYFRCLKKDKFEFRIRFSPNITHKLVTFSIVMHNINK